MFSIPHLSMIKHCRSLQWLKGYKILFHNPISAENIISFFEDFKTGMLKVIAEKITKDLANDL